MKHERLKKAKAISVLHERIKMMANTSVPFVEANSSEFCNDNLTSWNKSMEKMYTYFYLLLFIPGLLLNTTALWVLCRHIRCTL